MRIHKKCLKCSQNIFPKNIKNDCCLLITDHVDTKLWWKRYLNFTYVGTIREPGPAIKYMGTLAL